ncbi:MAG: aminotransferase class IV [Spirochaetaceae bacterium]|jgi:D-alanine transaminase|nr:aminotransferase class IV [Spirochaetaceae bacterium]
MKTLGYYNGTIGEIEDMSVPMSDRACYFGDGVYDASYSVNDVIFALDDHIDRFFNSAGLLEIKLTLTKPELKALLQALVKKVDKKDGVIVYWQVSRGTAPRNHVFPDVPSNLWVMIREMALRNNFAPFKVITLEDTRFLHCNIKTLNLIPSVLANEKAKRAGCDEAIFHRSGRVTECAHSNVHIIQNGILRTCPTDNLILPGIAREHLAKYAFDLNIPVDMSPFTLQELFTADEVIITSSGALCVPVSHIDGKPVGGKAPHVFNNLRLAVIEEFEAATGTKLPRGI